MQVVRDIKELREAVAGWRAAGESIALVPTMGALHAGHTALINAARAKYNKTALSIFVNPKQFGENEDFDTYPRTFESDRAIAEKHSVDLIWAPNTQAIYPKNFATSISVPKLSKGLCGKDRPAFFGGVATVVNKLLMQTMPDAAFFGEKDFQQLTVIQRMVTDCDIPTEIIGVPTIREADGLAFSSRNRCLNELERKVAPTLYTVLCEVRGALRERGQVQKTLEAAKNQLLSANFNKVHYLEYVDSTTLEPLAHLTEDGRLCAAVSLGTTRLIDNIEV